MMTKRTSQAFLARGVSAENCWLTLPAPAIALSWPRFRTHLTYLFRVEAFLLVDKCLPNLAGAVSVSDSLLWFLKANIALTSRVGTRNKKEEVRRNRSKDPTIPTCLS